ncbi:MAG TPA: CRISPR-associated helicase Cas3' [Pseudobacteroides sp.]|uniref:CRISPR-associated helicase Cas3' n=1 Tax=Pseudobacteroides sp. TaxID=1968840 RepID=UPI002F9590E6
MYTAHYRKSDKKHQTVKEHLIKVSEYCKIYGKNTGLPNTSELIGLIHDMGKLSDEFQEYITTAIVHEENGTLKEWKKSCSKVDHGRIGGMYIYNKFHNTAGYVKITSEIISMIVCYHHGGLHDFISFDCETPLLKRFERKKTDLSYQQATTRFFEQICDEKAIEKLFFNACKEIEALDKEITENKLSRPFCLQLLIKQLYSILIDADRYDTYLFMDNKEEPYPDTKVLWEQYSEIMENKISEFRNIKTNSVLEERIKQLRLEVSDACAEFCDRETGIYTLTVPTGGGKTLSSLRFALKHAAAKDKNRIIYILPFTTIIEQNANEIRDLLKCDDYLLEHHSNIIHDNDEDENNYKVLTQRWDCPIIFTTMVQFLETIYAGGTQSLRRMHNLSDSILIFDEIQAIPIRCISLFNSAINYLSKICNTTVILCSATQPNLSDTKIPLLKENNGEIIPDLSEKFKGFKRMQVEDKRIDRGYSYEILGDFIYELKKALSSVLIVLNTKSCAEKTYNELKKRNGNKEHVILYLSTNLCPSHRKKIIRVMKKCLNRKKSVICVSTQLIEAGINISFDSVVRHLAGLDSIAQATGRGNRHGEGDIKVSYIINLSDENLGSLKEIELGEKHAAEILYEYSKNSEKFDNDLLSPAAIKCYYNYYYADKDIGKLMNYPVRVKEHNCNTEIYKMLDGTVANKQWYEDKYGEKCQLYLNFMFETAGKHFRVIDDLTTSVIVPYGEGKKIIAGLFSSKSFGDKLKYLKLAQQYSVNIFENQMNRLKSENAFELSEIPGIYVLKDGYYDKSIGVVTEKQMEFLNI